MAEDSDASIASRRGTGMNTTRRTGAAIASVALISTFGLSACGGSSTPKAKDAWNKAQDTFGKQTSVTVNGSGKSDSGKPMSLSVSGDTKGTAYTMNMTQGSGHASLVVVGGKEYVKGDSDYYQNESGIDATLRAKMANKWIIDPEAPEESPLKDLVHHVQDDNDEMSKQLLSDKATVTSDSVDGTDAWKLTGPNKTSIAWVSKDGKHTLLKAQGLKTSKEDQATLTFKDYGKNFGITAPAGAKSAAAIALGG